MFNERRKKERFAGHNDTMFTDIQVEWLTSLLLSQREYPDTDNVIKIARFYLWDQIKVMESALEILDGDSHIRCFECRAADGSIIKDSAHRRCFWRVPASGDREPYTCTLGGCNCPRYAELAKSADVEHEPMCKHLVAVYLGAALGLVDVSNLPPGDFANQLTEAAASSIQLAAESQHYAKRPPKGGGYYS